MRNTAPAQCSQQWYGYNGTQSSEGIPFHFLLRDIAQYDQTVDDSFNRIFNACVAPACMHSVTALQQAHVRHIHWAGLKLH